MILVVVKVGPVDRGSIVVCNRVAFLKMSLVSVLASLVDPVRVLVCGIVRWVYIGVCRSGIA
jgi:hypothetical protein